MALISAQIRKGSTVLLPWHIVGGFSEGCTMLELFQSIKNGSIDLGTWVFPEKLRDLPITVSVGKSKTDAFDNVMANMNVVQTVSLFGHYVRFNLVEDKDQKRSTACEMPSESGTEDSGAESGKAKRNAFEVLISGARKLSLPEPYAADGDIVNNKRVLYNRVLQMLQKAGLGFTPTNFDQGKTLKLHLDH